MCAVNIATAPMVGGVQVTLTGASPTPADGIVDLIPAASTTPEGLAAGAVVPGAGAGTEPDPHVRRARQGGVSQVRVRCGDRRMTETRVAYTGH